MWCTNLLLDRLLRASTSVSTKLLRAMVMMDLVLVCWPSDASRPRMWPLDMLVTDLFVGGC